MWRSRHLAARRAIAYVDTTRDLPGMVEMSERLEAIYTRMYLASVGWDGTDPVRRAG